MFNYENEYKNDSRYLTAYVIITKKHHIKIIYRILPIYEEGTHKLKDFIYKGTTIVIDEKEILFNKTFNHSDFINKRTIKLSENFKNSLINDRNLIKDMFIYGKKIDKNDFYGYETDKNIFYSLFELDGEYIEELYS